MTVCRQIAIEAFNGPVAHGQFIDLPCCDWIAGFEVQTPDRMMCFALVDVNEQIMAALPHIAELPEAAPVTGTVTYYVGPYHNRNGACPLRLRVIRSGNVNGKPVPLHIVQLGITQ